MTEISDKPATLPAAIRRFVLHWGDMGATWGVNRSVGQIHALLYLSEQPLTAEDLADRLGLARSNVSNSVKELLQWGLIRREPVFGDRRDFYVAETDLWEMVARIAEGRKARELDPTLSILEACSREAASDGAVSPAVRQRIEAMQGLVVELDRWAAEMRKVPRAKLGLLVRLGSAVLRFIPAKAAAAADKKEGAS